MHGRRVRYTRISRAIRSPNEQRRGYSAALQQHRDSIANRASHAVACATGHLVNLPSLSRRVSGREQ